jgi:hypothetical protein
MRRADRKRWASARDLNDIAALVCAWLHGEVLETPTHAGPPDPETIPHLDVLAAVNRAGFVTENSQSAGPSWNGWIEGFGRAGAIGRLEAAAAGTRLTVAPLDRGAVRDIMRWYRHSCPAVVPALRAARFVCIEDPAPRRNDALWPALERFAGRSS